MKKLFFPLLLLLFFSCEKETFDPGNPSVEEFVQLISEGEYTVDYTAPLPHFKSYDIAALLRHSGNFKEVPQFPVNPISSFSGIPFRLGECLLWTVESIRITPQTAEKLSFPSLAPVLIKEGNEERLSEAELLEVYQLYETWWNNRKDKSFAELQSIDPLAGSGYRWR